MLIFKELIQGSDEWFEKRLGKITGTRYKSIISKKDDPVLIYEIVAEMIDPVIGENFVSFDMQRGIDQEPLARLAYENKTKRKTEQVGFVQHKDWEYCGYSPDSLVKEGEKYSRSIEIKCPSTKTHIKYINEGIIPKEYEGQVLGAFVCSDTIDYVDFISFDDRCTVKPLHIVTVTREQYQSQIDALNAAIPLFWAKVQSAYNKVVF